MRFVFNLSTKRATENIGKIANMRKKLQKTQINLQENYETNIKHSGKSTNFNFTIEKSLN